MRPAGQMPPDGGRRRPYNNHQNQHQIPQHHQYPPQMYNNYMQPYGASYYPQPPLPYHNAPMQHQYNPYPPYVRSPPPPMQHFAPAPLPPQQSYTRVQPSPVVSSLYQPPPPRAPSSTQSTHTIPAPLTPPTPQAAPSLPPSSPIQQETSIIPFRAPLPWFSKPDSPWPARKARRKRKPVPQLSADPVELPIISQTTNESASNDEAEVRVETVPESQDKIIAAEKEKDLAEEETLQAIVPRPETPSTSHPPSETNDSTNPTTPSSSQQTIPVAGDITPVAPKHTQKGSGPVVPALPKVISRDVAKPVKPANGSQVEPSSATEEEEVSVQKPKNDTDHTVSEPSSDIAPAPKAWTTPKLWTGLFNPNAPASVNAPASESGQASNVPGLSKPTSESLAEALRCFNATPNDSKVAFLKPRGLVNTGNMCYMNSVLQVLIFCTPFYTFLDQVSKRASHSFKSETPLIDAMILFMREYPVIDSAKSVDQLKLRLKEGELEQYGEAFTPDFVYNVINRLPRFSSMRRGHQQDAEEFLGFLLEGLHDECVQVMRNSASASTSAIATPTNNGPSSPVSEVGSLQSSISGKENGWLEVGPKQKAAVTRSSGTITTGSPITKIFGGNLRSELRVPGLKDSVTLEPYQPLQLDIGAPHVNNILDALKGLTRSEALHGDFKSPKGPNVTATKQVFIETLPPVLILHLKRFQYDNAGGTQKIWKKVGYPLELEIPKEVFPRQKRGVYAHSGLPKYRLIAVVYHHGKNASGGHYTVDVRRQDGREWIRLDDTQIRRVRSEEVAEAGNEEDLKVLAAALEAHKKDTPVSGNGFAAFEGAENEGDEEGWKKASGPGKKWSNVVNGASTPKSKSEKFSVKDNKVAYMLFYQKI